MYFEIMGYIKFFHKGSKPFNIYSRENGVNKQIW